MRAKLTNALLYCLRGNPILYQGEELGLPQAEIAFGELQDPEAIANWPRTLGRDGARTPMPWSRAEENCGFGPGKPWLPIGQGHAGLSVDIQEEDLGSVLNFTRELGRLRASSQALRFGAITFRSAADDVLVFHRSHGEETIECVFNLSGESRSAAIAGIGAARILASVGGDMSAGQPVPAHSCRIARL